MTSSIAGVEGGGRGGGLASGCPFGCQEWCEGRGGVRRSVKRIRCRGTSVFSRVCCIRTGLTPQSSVPNDPRTATHTPGSTSSESKKCAVARGSSSKLRGVGERDVLSVFDSLSGATRGTQRHRLSEEAVAARGGPGTLERVSTRTHVHSKLTGQQKCTCMCVRARLRACACATTLVGY